MITGELKTQIDKVWEAFWTGGLSNPINVIEQMTYLLFIRRLDELQTQKELRKHWVQRMLLKKAVVPIMNFCNTKAAEELLQRYGGRCYQCNAGSCSLEF